MSTVSTDNFTIQMTLIIDNEVDYGFISIDAINNAPLLGDNASVLSVEVIDTTNKRLKNDNRITIKGTSNFGSAVYENEELPMTDLLNLAKSQTKAELQLVLNDENGQLSPADIEIVSATLQTTQTSVDIHPEAIEIDMSFY